MMWQCSIEQNDSYMLGEETQRVSDPDLKQFYRWRFAKGEALHPAICTRCGRKLDKQFIDPEFNLHKKQFDFSYTYDGYLVVSPSAKDFLADAPGVAFRPLPSTDGFFWLDLVEAPQLEIDRDASGIRFENHCTQCKAYATVLLGIVPGTPPRPKPLAFANVSRPPDTGVFRTDLEFACSHEQHPLLLLGLETGRLLQKQEFKGIALKEIENPQQSAG